MIIMNSDPKYPIYQIAWKWVQDDINPKDEVRDKTQHSYKDLPDGRMRNSMSDAKMYKEEQDETALIEWAKDQFLHYVEFKNIEYQKDEKRHHLIMKNISDLEVKIIRKPDETWLLQWFNHYTFDIGQTDKEALNSFEQYVSRYEHFQNPHDFAEVTKEPGYLCLMGAEDRWRWKGEDGTKPAPCRCEHCKKQGIIRINH